MARLDLGAAFTIITAIAFSGFSSSGEAQVSISGFGGEWSGSGFQDNKTKWKIEISCRSGTECFISYPSLRCNGRLNLIENTGKIARFTETVVQGKCIDNGVVDLVQDIRDEKKLIFLWYYPGNGKIGAAGELYR
jgi:hypothetical protein